MNFFKLYMGDYQRDTGALSLAEHGAYLMMLQLYYATEKPLPLGADLYKILRVSGKKERAAVDKVAALFWIEKDGKLINTRAVAELEKSVRQRLVNQEVGKLGGRPKRNFTSPQEEPIRFQSTGANGSDPETESVSESKPNRNPNHSQIPDKTEEQEQKQPPATPVALRSSAKMPTPPDWIGAEAWAGFLAMRQRERHPLTPRAAQLVIRELDRLRSAGADPAAILDQSTRNGWRDVYPLKSTGETHANGSSRGKLSAVEQVEAAIRERRQRAAAAPPSAAEPHAAH